MNKSVYTISNYTAASNDQGHYNLGHTISDATEIQFRGSNASIAQQQARVCSINHQQHQPPSNREMAMSSDKMRISRRTGLGLDIGILILCTIWIAVIEIGFYPQRQRGFVCGDPLISQKFTGDTIKTTTLLISVLAVFFVVWIVEGIFYKPRGLKDSRIKQSAHIALKWYWKFICGLLFGYILVDAIKIFVGEKRPHFMQTCAPDTAVNCTIGEFIPSYVCTKQDESFIEMHELTKSFPSGHSCMSFYSGLFLAWYFQFRLPKLQSKLMLLFLQTMALLWSIFCAISRITDHRHHWWDVIAGSIFGIIFAVFTCTILCNNFKPKRQLIISDHSEDYESAPVICVKGLLSDSTGKDEVSSLQSGAPSPS